ncbi:MAG: glutamine--fructose-6-phosphate transaminase (isomerizing) [Actinobacteria bacterium]|nr:glutamine--fructose-6-phosphate transaminase (isomerizing) [Actinomycetota bacterium]MCL5886389.1 glutamine--fructose-6-phosphate transaminase (isomerizing) [Actinomycetota bacterium]
MCGIVAIIRSTTSEKDDSEPLPELLISCLNQLEYRGYDSAGIALGRTEEGGASLMDSNAKRPTIERFRAAVSTRSLEELKKLLESAVHTTHAPAGNYNRGIGHTRWATHGRPSERNAHPHQDCSGSIAVVHNGIIENWRELADELIATGHHLESETDSELIAHLVEEEIGDVGLLEATRRAAKRITGSFAIAIMDTNSPDSLVVVRRLSPLIIGTGKGICITASDIPALLGLADTYYVLEDDEIAEISPDSINVFDLSGDARELHPILVSWDLNAAQKSGYDDFMGKELNEQPAAIKDTLLGRVATNGSLTMDETRIDDDALRDVDKVFVVGCGSSFHSGLIAKYALEHWARIPTEIDISSEFRYRDPILNSSSLVIGVSQSGETMDTLRAISLAKSSKAKVISISNVVDSSITRHTGGVIYTRAGPEVGVAATKTFSTQIIALQMLALYLAQLKGLLYPDEIKTILEQMRTLPDLMQIALDRSDEVLTVAKEIANRRDLFYIGRNTGYPVALEGALKMKEIAYLRAEAYPAGELKHGPIALIEPGTVVIAVATRGRLWEKMHTNISEVKSRGATVVGIINDEDDQTASLVDYALFVPRTPPLLDAVVDIIPLQLLAYHMAKLKGFNVDRPRNLAKTVTVE